jgi:FkbM family methyltransferase
VSLIERVLRDPVVQEAPPVLVDIGASGELHPKWRTIAQYATCIAFEPDEREAGHLRHSPNRFRRLHVYPSAVAERAADEAPFYLTSSPYCSSRLQPDLNALSDYAFAPLFEVQRSVMIRTVDLLSVLAQLGLERVDWFKVDSQGTDLRLFSSLGDQTLATVLVAEFEPGIIDAYKGEDKLVDLMRFMDERGFWASSMRVQGSPRVNSKLIRDRLAKRFHAHLSAALQPAPGWAEIEYFNDFKSERLGKREFLLGFVFAYIRGHYGFALELAVRGKDRFGGTPFAELEATALNRIRRSFARLPLTFARSLAGRFAS